MRRVVDRYPMRISDHFDGRKFFDPWQKRGAPGFGEVLKWMLLRRRPKWPNRVEVECYDVPPRRVDGTALRITYVGHMTYLIQTASINILTDPVWSNRVSPFLFAGPKRVIEPGIRWKDLPPIDCVLLSHNHYDHLDLKTLDRLWKDHRPRIIAPLGNDRTIEAFNVAINIETYDWGESAQVGEGVKVHLHPTLHWSARGLWDRNRALWAAFNIETPGGNIYFVGDSGYGEGVHFKSAKARFGAFRLALLPMGGYEPRWFMEPVHMDPAEMIKAHQDLGEPWTVPGHFDVFQLTDEPYGDALRRLDAAKLECVKGERIRALKVGGTLEVPYG